jgi:hypothetical protein
MAREWGLHASRGSDFHSPAESRIALGTLPALPRRLNPVWELLADRIQPAPTARTDARHRYQETSPMAQYFEIHPVDPQPRLLQQATNLLRGGGILAVPTDSSYALVCHLDDKNAVDRCAASARSTTSTT